MELMNQILLLRAKKQNVQLELEKYHHLIFMVFIWIDYGLEFLFKLEYDIDSMFL